MDPMYHINPMHHMDPNAPHELHAPHAKVTGFAVFQDNQKHSIPQLFLTITQGWPNNKYNLADIYTFTTISGVYGRTNRMILNKGYAVLVT